MKLFVIGQSLEDHISSHGREEIKPGGIFYSVQGLKSVITRDDKIFLCTSVEKDNTQLFDTAYKFVEKSYFEFVPEIPKVYLNISADREREEKYSRINKSLTVNISDFNAFDGILINMITGFDITIDKLKKIRRFYKGLIYFDVHTLARGIDKDGKREFRTIPDFT